MSSAFRCRVCGAPACALARRPRGDVVELVFLHAVALPCLLVADPEDALALTIEAAAALARARRAEPLELLQARPAEPEIPAFLRPRETAQAERPALELEDRRARRVRAR